jgi:hypothetical protein
MLEISTVALRPGRGGQIALEANKESMTQRNSIDEQYDFSLVLGGPIFQLLRKAHLEVDDLELLRRSCPSNPRWCGATRSPEDTSHCPSLRRNANRTAEGSASRSQRHRVRC